MAFTLFDIGQSLRQKSIFEKMAAVEKSGEKVSKIRKKYGMKNPASDEQRDIEATARSESRAMQRAGGSGRSSTLLSNREELGLSSFQTPSKMDIAELNAPRTGVKMWRDQDAALAKVRASMIKKGIGDDDQLYDAGLDPDYKYRNAPSTEKLRERVEKKKAKAWKTLLPALGNKSDGILKNNVNLLR